MLIDNTPPVVTLSAAASGQSPGPCVPVEAVDGVTDSPHEKFHIVLDNLRPGEQLIVVRVYDTANNAGLAKVVVR